MSAISTVYSPAISPEISLLAELNPPGPLQLKVIGPEVPVVFIFI